MGALGVVGVCACVCVCVCVIFVYPNNVQKKHKNRLPLEKIIQWASDPLCLHVLYFLKSTVAV